MQRRGKGQRRSAAIEVSGSQLHLVVLDPDAAANRAVVRALSVRWRQNSTLLHSELGLRELTVALTGLASQQRLSGQPVHFTLNGDYCVTRVVTGGQEHIRRELELLEERSALYLGLGHGQKLLAQSVTPIDARHQLAHVTVINRQMLEGLVQAAQAARLEIDHVEPSLFALSRCLGRAGLDQTDPAIIIALGDGGAELGISHQGRLLLDYRPSGRVVGADIADVIARHQHRLQKFFNRHYGLTQGQLRQVFLCGSAEMIRLVRPGFDRCGDLSVQVLRPAAIDAQWRIELSQSAENTSAGNTDGGDSIAGSEFCAALGTCLAGAQPAAERTGPNLMEPVRAAHREPLGPALWKALWPAAAALLVAATLFTVATVNRLRSRSLADQVAEIEPAQTRVRQLRTDLMRTDGTARQLREVRDRIDQQPPVELLVKVAHCLPPDVWLERLEASSSGQVTLSGVGMGDEAVYEFVRWLREAPGLAEVQLEGTSGIRVAGGLATRFDLKFEMNRQSNQRGGSEKSDGNDSKGLSGKSRSPEDRHNPNFEPGPVAGLAGSR